MNWFQHDTASTQDAKIKKLIIRHQAVGYAVYFHCLELIASDISENNLTFELEHDSEIIADNLKITGTGDKSGREIVEEIMHSIIELGLFSESEGHIFCFKLLKRINLSMTSSAKFRKAIDSARTNHHDAIMTHHDDIMAHHATNQQYQPTIPTNTQDACVSGFATFPNNYSKILFDAWALLPGVPQPQEYLSWILSQSHRDVLNAIRGYHSDEILSAIKNYQTILEHPDDYWITAKQSIGAFFSSEVFQKCRPSVFPASALKEKSAGKDNIDWEKIREDLRAKEAERDK
jgi:hypothetical protein